MRTKDAKKYFRTNAAISRALDISVQAVGKWGDTVPYFSAVQLMRVTHGVLSVDDRLYNKRGRPRAA